MKTEQNISSETDIKEIIKNDRWMMDVLRAAESLNLPDWWIGAGFVRNKIWDMQHGFNEKTRNDIDVIYFNKSLTSKETEREYENKLRDILPNENWTVKNIARMHLVSGDSDFPPYRDSIDGFSHWPEVATCVAVTKRNEKLILEAPFGVDDIIKMEVRPNLKFPSSNVYNRRIREKNWKDIWPKLRFFDFEGIDITAEIKAIEQ